MRRRLCLTVQAVLAAYAIIQIYAAQAAPSAEFPCETLGKDLIEQYRDLGQPTSTPASPVIVAEKAVLFEASAPLVHEGFVIEKPKAYARLKDPPMIFRPYRSSNTLLYCTEQKHEMLFGDSNKTDMFLLGCLIDADNDGLYETGALEGPKRDHPNLPKSRVLPWRLARPVYLTRSSEATNLQPATYHFNRRVRFSKVTEEEVTIFVAEGISFGAIPSGRDSINGRGLFFKTKLAEGAEVKLMFAHIRFERRENQWIAALVAPPTSPRLQCNGSVITLDDSYIVTKAGRIPLFETTDSAAPPIGHGNQH